MKLASVKLLCSFIFLLVFANASAQNFFNDAPESSMKLAFSQRVIIPQKYRTLRLDTTNLSAYIKLIPSEKNISNRDMTPEIAIPMPDGTVARFHIWESSVLAPELAAANPNIKTFTGQGIDDKTATIKVDWTEFGFHAMILSPVTGSVFIDPYDQKTVINYISYYKADYKKKDRFTELIQRLNPGLVKKISSPDNVLTGICVGTQLRTYRLAVACTGEYAVAVTKPAAPTKPAVLSKIVTTVNRVDGVYEKELSIRLVLVAAENSIIFINSATDPFLNNNNGNILISESQRVIDSAIGNANYDVGHTFSTGGGGLASVGVVCQTDFKAGGVTGSPTPYNDPYDIDFVAHELGHQFGADHTFNSTQGGCDGNQLGSSNVEPGSGSTIMAYAGICGADDLQPNSDAQFHTISFDEILSYSNLISPNCATVTNTGNATPVVNAGSNYTIPVSTPFILTGSATDANGDALTYSWEEIDGGGPLGAWNAPSGNAPLFR
jgi:Metallo-peptidase family M12B Reprolysin-like